MSPKLEDIIPSEVLEEGRQKLDSGYDTKGMLSLLYIDLLRICEEEGLISASDLERQDSSDYILFFVLVSIVLIVLMIYLYQRKRKNKETTIPKHHDESV